jgi:hypothetical protein
MLLKKIYRRLVQPFKVMAVQALPALNRFLETRLRLHLVRRHYYSPVPDPDDIGPGYWDQVSEMPGVDLGYERGLAFMREVVPLHIGGFRKRMPLQRTAGNDFFLINGTYMAVDAHVYWCMILHYKPKRIVEIGAHASTMISTAAVAALREESGHVCRIDAIEPFPTDYLRRENGRTITLIEKKVQELPLSYFLELEAGDILFVDSTHMMRQGSDVQYEYLEIIPRLKPGVLIHVHDVSLPRHYPKVYFDNQLYWNEQYFLQALLVFNNRLQVEWAGNGLMLKYPAAMLETFPEINDMRAVYPSSEPTAFWMRVKA